MLPGELMYLWIGLLFLAIGSVSSVGWWAYRTYLRLQEQLATTREQLARKEEKEREELVKKLKLRRANILLQPVTAIAPPNPSLEEHTAFGELGEQSSSSVDGKGYIGQMNGLLGDAGSNNPDIYHSVRPLDYWKHYQNHQEGLDQDEQYHGYSRPQLVNSESLTNPLKNHHSINWNKRYAHPFSFILPLFCYLNLL